MSIKSGTVPTIKEEKRKTRNHLSPNSTNPLGMGKPPNSANPLVMGKKFSGNSHFALMFENGKRKQDKRLSKNIIQEARRKSK